MADGSIAAPPSAPFPITNPERIPSQRYYDTEFYRLECERLWPHVWQMACRLEQIPNVGDWIEYANLGKSIIVVRTSDGVKAYHNACRHRGVRLVKGNGNCKGQGFICPFHGWRWNMEGANTFVYGKHLFSQEQLDKSDLALPQCRTELWGGFVFVNFNDDAPSLRESIGPVLDNLAARNMDTLRAEWWIATELPANWKIAMEAFMEGYHVLRTHPQLHQASPSRYNQRYGADTGGLAAVDVATVGGVDAKASVRDNIRAQLRSLELLSEGMAGMVQAKEIEIAYQLADVELPDDPAEGVKAWIGMLQAEITRQLRERGENVPDLNAVSVSHPVVAVEFIFPHVFFLPTFSSMAYYRIRPTGPETCLFEISSLTQFPKGEEPAPIMEPTVLAYDSKDFPPIPQQDYANIPEQQLGLHADGFDFMRLARTGEGLISNYQRVIDGYLGGAGLDRLATATQELGGNFDGPIKSFAF